MLLNCALKNPVSTSRARTIRGDIISHVVMLSLRRCCGKFRVAHVATRSQIAVTVLCRERSPMTTMRPSFWLLVRHMVRPFNNEYDAEKCPEYKRYSGRSHKPVL